MLFHLPIVYISLNVTLKKLLPIGLKRAFLQRLKFNPTNNILINRPDNRLQKARWYLEEHRRILWQVNIAFFAQLFFQVERYLMSKRSAKRFSTFLSDSPTQLITCHSSPVRDAFRKIPFSAAASNMLIDRWTHPIYLYLGCGWTVWNCFKLFGCSRAISWIGWTGLDPITNGLIRASAVLKKNQGGGMWREEESTASCVEGEGRKNWGRREKERKGRGRIKKSQRQEREWKN